MTTTDPRPRTKVIPEGNRWQARYFDSELRLWFDLGDPRDTESEAAELARTWDFNPGSLGPRCAPCAAGEHADDGTGQRCPCCGTYVAGVSDDV